MKRKILVVDDAATVRSYHRSILEKQGYEVEEAVNGMEALEKSLRTHYDLYVVDINMPKMDGYTFVEELRKMDIFQPPVIMVSTESELKDKRYAYRAGASAYLIKPVSPESLETYVKILLGEV